jgi:hypothetical protein
MSSLLHAERQWRGVAEVLRTTRPAHHWKVLNAIQACHTP